MNSIHYHKTRKIEENVKMHTFVEIGNSQDDVMYRKSMKIKRRKIGVFMLNSLAAVWTANSVNSKQCEHNFVRE